MRVVAETNPVVSAFLWGRRQAADRRSGAVRPALLAMLLLIFVDGKRCESAIPQHGDVTIIDAMPEFWKFWDTASENDDDRRVQDFLSIVVAPHPDLFDVGVLGGGSLTNRFDDPSVQKSVAMYLHDVAPWIPRMRFLSKRVRNFRRYAQEFRIEFPDYAPITPVYFTVSLFTFDAGVRMAGGDTAVFFSIDGIARFDGADANLKVIIDHELFHQYHHQIVPELTDNRALWAYLWEEGLATFVSQQMNLGSTEDQVLLVPPNLAERASPLLPTFARELLDKLDSTNQEDLAAFFAFDNHRPDLPKRCGYYVGYRLAKKLASGRSLQALASLRGPALRSAIQMALEEMAKSP